MKFNFEFLFRKLRQNQVIDLVKNGNILDIGCGPENSFLNLIKVKITNGVGIERKAGNPSKDNLSVLQMDIELETCPIEYNNYFDQAFLLASLEHFDRPDIVLGKIYDLLKQGGEIYITTPSKMAKPILKTLAKINLLDRNEIDEHKHYFNRSELHVLLKTAGFKNIKITYFELGFNQLIVGKK